MCVYIDVRQIRNYLRSSATTTKTANLPGLAADKRIHTQDRGDEGAGKTNEMLAKKNKTRK